MPARSPDSTPPFFPPARSTLRETARRRRRKPLYDASVVALAALLLVGAPPVHANPVKRSSGLPTVAAPRPQPSLRPRPIIFTADEMAKYENAQRLRDRRLIIYGGGSAIGTLLALGTTLLVVGLAKEPGNATMTSLGVTSLSLGIVAGFIGLEMYEW